MSSKLADNGTEIELDFPFIYAKVIIGQPASLLLTLEEILPESKKICGVKDLRMCFYHILSYNSIIVIIHNTCQ